jgi:hypothetical protein
MFVVSQKIFITIYKSWWTMKSFAHFTTLELARKIGKPIDVWVNTNADDVELFLTEKVWVKKQCQETVICNGKSTTNQEL